MHSTYFLRVTLFGTLGLAGLLGIGTVGCGSASSATNKGDGVVAASSPSSISTIAVPSAASAASAPRPVDSPASPSAARFLGADFKLEGLVLGARIAEFENVYYETVCDTDPLDDKTHAVWFHAAKPCREAKALPGNTVMAIFTTFTSEKNPYDKVLAIAWFGDFPNTGGNFPLKIGIRLAEGEKTLGPAKKLFDIKAGRQDLTSFTVHLHAGGTYSFTRGDTIVGYAVGAMGSDPEKEEWRGMFDNVSRYRAL